MREQIETIFRRISSLINRNVIVRVDNTKKNQLVYTSGLFGQEKEVEFIEPYGLTAYPVEDGQSEVVRFSYNGVEDMSLANFGSGGIYRPKDHLLGETVLYSYLDAEDKHRVHLKQGREIDIFSTENVSTKMTPESLTHSVLNTSIAMQENSIKASVNDDVFIEITDSAIVLNVKGANVLQLTEAGTDWLMNDYEAHQ